MFSTFTAAPEALVPSNVNSASPSGSRSGISDNSEHPSASGRTNSLTASIKTKPKRNQVSRACDWCRIHRIKCDSTHPCQNCQARGGQCSNRRAPQVHTLPQAFREIERLRQKVKELEGRLQNPTPSKPSGPEDIVAFNTPVSLPDLATSLNPQPDSVRRRYWDGVYASPDNTQAKQFFGPSSLLYFLKWMEGYLATTLQQPYTGRNQLICFNSANKSFAQSFAECIRELIEHMSLEDSTDRGRHKPTCPHVHDQEQYLTTTQEEYFLSLFWQSYHNSIQILDEHAFREHYRSLCDMPGRSRKPSALVDIVVAICMQYGMARLPPQERDDAKCHSSQNNRTLEQPSSVSGPIVDVDDATIAGRWYYYRSQALLAADLENPTVTTLQCYILSIVYLCNANFHTSAYNILGLAVRIALTLGLHLEPDEDTPYVDRELQKRIWWTLQTVEMKTCMKLGRPVISSPPETSPLPSDGYRLALLSSSTTSIDGDVTWLTYTVQNTKLLLAAYATQVAFFDRCNELLTRYGGDTIYEDYRILEKCALFLQTSLRGPQGLQTWLSGVPEALKSRRKAGGKAYSTDCSALEIERFVPIWLQRHRLLLELLYHHLSVTLFRPFITFPSGLPKRSSGSVPSSPASLPSTFPGTSPSSLLSASTTANSRATPLAQQNAHSCVRHAIALTLMIHEALGSTDHLGGWHEAFQWQWDAAISLVGFILSDPGSEEIHRSARRAIDHAIDVFGTFASHFGMAASAARVTRDLVATADRLVERRWRVRAGVGGWRSGDDGVGSVLSVGSSSGEEPRTVSPGLGSETLELGVKGPRIEPTGGLVVEAMVDDDAVRSLLGGTMPMAYGLDSFGGVDFSLPEVVEFSEGWNYRNTWTAHESP